MILFLALPPIQPQQLKRRLLRPNGSLLNSKSATRPATGFHLPTSTKPTQVVTNRDNVRPEVTKPPRVAQSPPRGPPLTALRGPAGSFASAGVARNGQNRQRERDSASRPPAGSAAWRLGAVLADDGRVLAPSGRRPRGPALRGAARNRCGGGCRGRGTGSLPDLCIHHGGHYRNRRAGSTLFWGTEQRRNLPGHANLAWPRCAFWRLPLTDRASISCLRRALRRFWRGCPHSGAPTCRFYCGPVFPSRSGSRSPAHCAARGTFEPPW